ncbi:trimethylamine methyltransferase family protein [Dehalobacterium formicoaceticum]|uniref:Trimethylamine methyltransferase family protein n=1 Tax=Dehalobacterium formicoaceticum TaxID=51515 RepID=A0ABT1Y227_9FIRM|nr:trimethylamine methyltransferase family protein [Dehalobacterium formicoaceticum]MCR6544014.1 trimethylamine methyltransferase family protein [Dehalobacterium formicoaceticum]
MRFDYYTEEQLQQVHEASLDLLKKVGISTSSERFRALLLDHGCVEKGNRILFTQDVIDKGMKTVPPVFNLHGRNNGPVLEIGKKKGYCQTLVGAPSVIDLESGVRRDCMVQDLADITRLADALENVDIISPLFPRDVPQEIILTMETVVCLRNTSKPLSICVESSRELQFIKELLIAVAGSEEALREKPLATLPVSPVSPLEYGFDPAEALLDVVAAGLPLGVEPCPQMGATGPMSMNGLVAMHNAEILAGVIAAQLYQPGCPLTMSSRATFMDMRSGLGLWAMPEMGMMSAGLNQLGRYYQIPVAPGGYCGSSKVADMQSAYEHLYNALMEGLAGSDIIGSAGSLDNALISCYVMLVVDDELSSVVKRTIKEIKVNADNLAVDVVAEVIENQDNFLGHKHTRKYLRSGELWKPGISQRQTFEKWAQQGQKLEDVAKEKAAYLLATHQSAPLSSEIENEFDKILASAKKALME